MIIFHILVCVWMCFCLALPRQEPIFQPLHSSPTATSTGSPRLSERGWRAIRCLWKTRAPPPRSVWPSDWSAGSQTTSSGAVTVMLSEQLEMEKIGKKSQTMQVESGRKEQRNKGRARCGGKDGGSWREIKVETMWWGKKGENGKKNDEEKKIRRRII